MVVSTGSGLDEQDLRAYGRAFAGSYDRIFPRDGSARDAVDFLRRTAGGRAPTFAEFGVGTGRIAVPLARGEYGEHNTDSMNSMDDTKAMDGADGLHQSHISHISHRATSLTGPRVWGVDISAELLEIAQRQPVSGGGSLRLVEADIRSWVCPEPVSVAYCICATISMLPSHDDIRSALQSMVESIGPTGVVVIETHCPTAVSDVHRLAAGGWLQVDLPALPGGLEMRSELSGSRWTVRHRWSENATERSALERSLVLTPDELTELAASVGLHRTGLHTTWNRARVLSRPPTYICTFEKN